MQTTINKSYLAMYFSSLNINSSLVLWLSTATLLWPHLQLRLWHLFWHLKSGTTNPLQHGATHKLKPSPFRLCCSMSLPLNSASLTSMSNILWHSNLSSSSVFNTKAKAPSTTAPVAQESMDDSHMMQSHGLCNWIKELETKSEPRNTIVQSNRSEERRVGKECA